MFLEGSIPSRVHLYVLKSGGPVECRLLQSSFKEEHKLKAILDPIKICKKKAVFQFENKNKSPLGKKI